MAIHCFFTQILPDDAQIIFEDKDFGGICRVRKNICASTCLQKNWDAIFRAQGFALTQSADDSGRVCRTLNDRVDFFVETSVEGGTYLTLVGSYSCYDTSIAVMAEAIKTVAASAEENVKLFAHGAVVRYDEIDAAEFLYAQFNDGYDAFKKIFSDDHRVISPSQFWKRKKSAGKFLFGWLKKRGK